MENDADGEQTQRVSVPHSQIKNNTWDARPSSSNRAVGRPSDDPLAAPWEQKETPQSDAGPSPTNRRASLRQRVVFSETSQSSRQNNPNDASALPCAHSYARTYELKSCAVTCVTWSCEQATYAWPCES